MNANSTPLEKQDIFALMGYLGCSAATVALAVTMLLALRIPLLLTGQDGEIMRAALVSFAAGLGAVSVTFEAYIAKLTRTPFISLIVGFSVLPAFVWVLTFHGVLPWAVLGTVLIRQIALCYKIRQWSLLAVFVSGTMIGYWAFLLIYVDGYKTIWINEAVVSGTVHVDMMFHAAIVNMLSGFNAPSLGVDGTAPFPYHFASHRIVVFFCRLLGIDALQFYATAFNLLFAPLFILAFFFFSISFLSYLNRIKYIDPADMTSAYSGWFWTTFFVVLVGISSINDRRNLGVWDNVFHSESFGVAVLFSYLAGIWLFGQLEQKSPVRFRWYVYPLMAAYLIFLCSLKISVGAVVGGLLAYLILRLPLISVERVMAWLAILSAVAYGYLLTRGAAQGTSDAPTLMQTIKPFAFIRDVLPPKDWAPSFLAFFGPTIIFIILRCSQSCGLETPRLTSILKTAPRDIEIIIVLTGISITPGLLLSIPQGSTNFFAEVSYWWAQPMLAIVLTSTFVAAIKTRPNRTP